MLSDLHMSKHRQPIHSVRELLTQLSSAKHDEQMVSIDMILDTLGRRSFGPIILTIGLILAVPGVSDIPTVPSILGSLVVLLGFQIVIGREYIWLPQWLLRQTVRAERLDKVIAWLDRPANWIDSLLKPRLQYLTAPWSVRVIAVVTIMLALLTPAMEIVPLSANVAGVAFTFFGLGLVAQDGLMNALGFTFCAVLGGILALAFFG